MPKVVTANLLSTGTVVFLGTADRWVGAISDARIFSDDHAADDGLAQANRDVLRAIVVDPFVSTVGADVAGRPAMTLRDSIRAYGPTIRFRPNNVGSVDEARRGE